MFCIEEEYDIAQEDEIPDDMWVSAPGFVLKQDGVLSPMISDFHSAPMVPDGLQPLLRRFAVCFQRRKVIGILPSQRVLFCMG